MICGCNRNAGTGHRFAIAREPAGYRYDGAYEVNCKLRQCGTRNVKSNEKLN